MFAHRRFTIVSGVNTSSPYQWGQLFLVHSVPLRRQCTLKEISWQLYPPGPSSRFRFSISQLLWLWWHFLVSTQHNQRSVHIYRFSFLFAVQPTFAARCAICFASMALDQAVIAVFGPPPANVNLDDSQVAQDNAAVISLLAIATVAVILRFIARFSMKQPFKTDDCLIIVSLVSLFLTTVILLLTSLACR